MTDRGDFDDLDDFFARSRRPVALVDRPARPAPRPARPSRPARPARPTPVRGPAPVGPTRPRAPRPAPAPRARRPRPLPVDGAVALRRTRRRLVGFVVVVALAVAAIGARLTDLQVTGRDRWVTYGADQRDGFRILPAGRGGIYDRRGQAFALSVAVPEVVADPTSVDGPIRTARELAPILGLPVDDLAAKLGKDNRYQLLKSPVSATVVAKIHKARLAGITVEQKYVRKSPSGTLARNVVGTPYADGGVDADGYHSRRGIERAWEDRLEGTPGKLSFEKDPSGGTIAGGETKVEPAEPGTNVYVTLDQSLQYATEQALIDQVEATGAKKAMAIISRPSTGEVLAMASVADDGAGNVTNTGSNSPVSDVFEPGSVNKMITVAGALEQGLIDPTTPHDVPDHLQVADHLFTDHDPHPTENWSTTDILANSSNIGTIKIAQQLGKAKVDAYLRDFGFGRSSGLPEEVNGLMLPRDQWSGTSIGAIPIGQGIGVTALQMLSAYNVLSNDGVYVAPKLVAATDSGSGKTPTEPSARHRVISPATAAAMRQMLAKVVSDGTGKPAQVPGYVPFGKTGTARIPQPDGGDPKDGYKDANGSYHYIGTFVGGIDGADLSIIVTVQEATTSIYGSDLAAPVFAQLAALTLRHEQVPPPALVEASKASVPDLSPSALDVDGEDPGPASDAAQG